MAPEVWLAGGSTSLGAGFEVLKPYAIPSALSAFCCGRCEPSATHFSHHASAPPSQALTLPSGSYLGHAVLSQQLTPRSSML